MNIKERRRVATKPPSPRPTPLFFVALTSIRTHDKESSVSADFEVADASLALISLGRCSPGRTAGDLGEGKFSVSCILAGLCRR